MAGTHRLRSVLCAGVLLVALVVPLDAARADGEVPASALGAWRALRQGRTADALSLSERAVAEVPTSAYAWSLRGYVLSRTGAKDAAADAYRQAAVLDATDPVAQNNLGAVLLDLGRAAEARDAFRRALQLRAGYADAQNNLGAALERLGRTAEAAAAYRAATRDDASHATAHNNLGALAVREGRVDEARRALTRANQLDPQLGAPVLNLLLLGMRGGDGATDDALRQAAEQPGAAPAVRARWMAVRAQRASEARRFEEARGLYLQALALTPRDASLLNNLAVAEDQLGADREAVLHLEEALRLRPTLLVARNNIGIVQVHRGQFGLAEDVFRGILAQDPDFHRAHYNLGIVLAAQAKLDAALRSFEQAARLAPRDADVRYNLGLLRRRTGGTEDGERRAYEAALLLDPDHPEAHLSLGCFLADPQTRLDLRDEAKAREHLERFLDLATPTDVDGRGEARAWLAWLAGRGGN